MISYDNKIIDFKECPGCAYAKHEFTLSCQIAFENNNFILSQDWETPIEGFMVLSPKRHIETLEELSKLERDEMFDIIDKIIKILRRNNICEKFNVLFYEKENTHFNIWIMPRHHWMNNIVDNITCNMGVIFEYAKSHFRNDLVYDKIKEITLLLRKELNK